MTRPGKIPTKKAGVDPRICRSQDGRQRGCGTDKEQDRLFVCLFIRLFVFSIVTFVCFLAWRKRYTSRPRQARSDLFVRLVCCCSVWAAPRVCWLGGRLTSQQHASVSQGRICTDNCTCCHTEIEAADLTYYLTRSQYTDTGPTSLSADPITPGAWQGSHCSANFQVTGMTRPGKIPSQAGFEPRIFRSRGGRLNHLANEAFLLQETLRFLVVVVFVGALRS